MPLDNPTEHLQDSIRRLYRREVREWFKDLNFDEELDITVPRTSLAQACDHDNDDSMIVTLARMLLFESLRGRFQALLAGIAGDNDDTGTTRLKPHILRKSRPQIILYFFEDVADVQPGYAPVDGRISFRLMSHTAETITPAIAQTFATRVKSNFALGNGYIWKKGREMYSYTDWEKGYQLQLLTRNETDARDLVNQVLDIQTDTPDWKNFNSSENAEPAGSFPPVPELEYIYGSTRRLPRRRPVADVRFQYAVLVVPGLAYPITLVDRSGVLPAPLVS